MAKTINYTINTLTPIWTGGASGICDRIHASGIVGGLRNWYEIILRGLNYSACDPTSEKSRCPQKGDERCDACQLFGCTDWRRRFSIVLGDGQPTWAQDANDRILGKGLNIRPSMRNHGWWRGAGRLGSSIPLEIICKSPNDNEIVGAALPMLLEFCSRWTGLGSKLQHGFGVVQVNPDGEAVLDSEQLVENFKSALQKNEIMLDQKNLPNLEDFFFAKIRFNPVSKKPNILEIDGCPDSSYVKQQLDSRRMKKENADKYRVKLTDKHYGTSLPVAPAIKNTLRYGIVKPGGSKLVFSVGDQLKIDLTINWSLDKDKLLFGTIKNGKIGSRVAVSDAYPIDGYYEFKAWGLVSDQDERKAIFNSLNNAMKSAGNIIFGGAIRLNEIVWREKGSNGRCHPPCDDSKNCASCNTAETFLRCLLS